MNIKRVITTVFIISLLVLIAVIIRWFLQASETDKQIADNIDVIKLYVDAKHK